MCQISTVMWHEAGRMSGNALGMAQEPGRMHGEHSRAFGTQGWTFATPAAEAHRRLPMCGEPGRMLATRGRMPPGRIRTSRVRGRIAAAGLANRGWLAGPHRADRRGGLPRPSSGVSFRFVFAAIHNVHYASRVHEAWQAPPGRATPRRTSFPPPDRGRFGSGGHSGSRARDRALMRSRQGGRLASRLVCRSCAARLGGQLSREIPSHRSEARSEEAGFRVPPCSRFRSLSDGSRHRSATRSV